MRKGETTQRGRASRDAILDAAVEEFTSKGFRASSLKGIADRADITKSGLLHHFPSKEDLLAAVLAERTAVQRDAVARAGLGESARVLDEMRATVAHNQTDPKWVRFFTIMVAESFTDRHPALPVVQKRYETVIDGLGQRLRAEHPAMTEAESRELAALTVATMDGLQILRMVDESFDMRGPFSRLESAIQALNDSRSTPSVS